MRLAIVVPVLLAVSLGGLTFGAEAGAATVGSPLPLAACPTAVAADASGAVRLLTRTQRRGRWTAAISTVDAAGAVTAGRSVSRRWKTPNKVRSVLTADGLAVAYETGQPKPEPEGDIVPAVAARAGRTVPTVSVATLAADGSTTTQVISDPSREAELDEISSRAGTTVVSFRQTVPHQGWLQEWIAVRPAGAARFLPAVSLKSRLRDKFSFDEVSLGADGSGVVLSVPMDSRLIVARRIGRDGRVGRALAVGERPSDIADARAAVGPNGEVVVAKVDTDRPKHYGTAGVFISLLEPGASAFTTPRLVGRERYDTGVIGDNLSIAIDDAGQVTVVTGRQFSPGTTDFAPALATYSGRGDQLVAGNAIAAIPWDPVILTPTVGGGMALSWRGFEVVDRERDILRTAQYLSFRAPDGSWSVAQPVSPPFIWDAGDMVMDKGVVALPNGGIAMAYSIERYGHRTRCYLVRATL